MSTNSNFYSPMLPAPFTVQTSNVLAGPVSPANCAIVIQNTQSNHAFAQSMIGCVDELGAAVAAIRFSGLGNINFQVGVGKGIFLLESDGLGGFTQKGNWTVTGLQLTVNAGIFPAAEMLDVDGVALLRTQGADPAASALGGKLYCKDVAGTVKLFFRNSAGLVSQISP